MNWKDIYLSPDNKSYYYRGKLLFGKTFLDALSFHYPAIAAVKDKDGSYHIDTSGNALYKERYTRTFGFYCGRATVVQGDNWFHITEKGRKAYSISFCWTGNYQENLCPVRDNENKYFHIDLVGSRIYNDNYKYAGDFKSGVACVKTIDGLFRHIDISGKFINEKSFQDLGIFHKNFATAKDKIGWHHINKAGIGLYPERYLIAEPFYNGFANVETFDNKKQIIDEEGNKVLEL